MIARKKGFLVKKGDMDRQDWEAENCIIITWQISFKYIQTTRRAPKSREASGFQDVVVEFVPQFKNAKQLACELRSNLFLIKGKAVFTETFRSKDISSACSISNECSSTAFRDSNIELCLP